MAPADRPGRLSVEDVPDWVKLDHAEYARRRNEEIDSALQALDFHGSWEKYAASLFRMMSDMAPDTEHWGSRHHQFAILAAALIPPADEVRNGH